VKGNSLRITDIEKEIGVASGDAPTVWSAVSGLTSTVTSSAMESSRLGTRITDIDNELTQIFAGVKSFEKTIDSLMNTLTARVDAIEQGGGNQIPVSNTATAPPDGYQQTILNLETEIKNMQKERVADQLRIDSLESRLDSSSKRIELIGPGGQTVSIRSAVDVYAYLDAVGAKGVDFGGFADVYNYLTRIQTKRVGSGTMDQLVKTKKDVISLNLSEDEALSLYTHSFILPTMFGGKATAKSSLGGLQSYKDWRSKSTLFGLAYDIKNHMTLVEQEIKAIIDEQYSSLPYLKALALEVSLMAKSFVMDLVRWVDDTYSQLVDSGNPADDVLWIITRVVKSIFEEYFAPARLTPTKTTFTSHAHQASALLWGVLQSHLAAKDMSKKTIKDHPIVVGAYAQWLVSHSGRKEADVAKKAADKASALAQELKTNLDKEKKVVNELKTKVEAVKRTADKALVKAQES
jgi:hypothetical protein